MCIKNQCLTFTNISKFINTGWCVSNCKWKEFRGNFQSELFQCTSHHCPPMQHVDERRISLTVNVTTCNQRTEFLPSCLTEASGFYWSLQSESGKVNSKQNKKSPFLLKAEHSAKHPRRQKTLFGVNKLILNNTICMHILWQGLILESVKQLLEITLQFLQCEVSVGLLSSYIHTQCNRLCRKKVEDGLAQQII